MARAVLSGLWPWRVTSLSHFPGHRPRLLFVAGWPLPPCHPRGCRDKPASLTGEDGSRRLPFRFRFKTTAAYEWMPFLLMQLLSSNFIISLYHIGLELAPFQMASFFLRILQGTCLSWDDKVHTWAFMCLTLSGVLVRMSLYLQRLVRKYNKNLPFF